MAHEHSPFEKDILATSRGDLEITFISHATLMIRWGGLVLHLDPVAESGWNYSAFPKADLVLLTHEHDDHLDPAALATITKPGTDILLPAKAAAVVSRGRILGNGDQIELRGITVEAVPAYNIVHMRSPGVPFHPRGEGNGYILTLGDFRLYVAGDTENTPEMKSLRKIDAAFLPMNLPYTMTPEMVADAAVAFRPRILYPYHYGRTDPARISDLLKDEPDIEVRIRALR